MHHRTEDGRAYRTLNIIDEFSRECLVIRVKRKLNSTDVIDALTGLFIVRGVPTYIRSDNGPEFIAEAVRLWIKAVGAKTAYIEPVSPWENGYCDSFNARFRNELLNGEIFYSLREAQIVIKQWRRHYNTKRPHPAHGYKPLATESIITIEERPMMHSLFNRTKPWGRSLPFFAFVSFIGTASARTSKIDLRSIHVDADQQTSSARYNSALKLIVMRNQGGDN